MSAGTAAFDQAVRAGGRPRVVDLSPSPPRASPPKAAPRTPSREAACPSTPPRSSSSSGHGRAGSLGSCSGHAAALGAVCADGPSQHEARRALRRATSTPEKGRDRSRGQCTRQSLDLEDDGSPDSVKMPAPKRARLGSGVAAGPEGAKPCAAEGEGRGEPLSPEAEQLFRLVLQKAGRHSDKVVSLLRARVAAGRKVHGQTFTSEAVEEAVRRFRTAEEAPKEPTALLPFHSNAQPLAYQGSYMPPAAVSRLVGDEICAICLDPLRFQAQTIALCGHIFHRSCLNAAGSSQCPTCRRPVDLGDVASIRELKSLILSTRRSDSSEPAHLRCNVLELSRNELLADCNRRRRDGLQPFTKEDLSQALEQLAGDPQLLVEEDSVVLLL